MAATNQQNNAPTMPFILASSIKLPRCSGFTAPILRRFLLDRCPTPPSSIPLACGGEHLSATAVAGAAAGETGLSATQSVELQPPPLSSARSRFLDMLLRGRVTERCYVPEKYEATSSLEREGRRRSRVQLASTLGTCYLAKTKKVRPSVGKTHVLNRATLHQ